MPPKPGRQRKEASSENPEQDRNQSRSPLEVEEGIGGAVDPDVGTEPSGMQGPFEIIEFIGPQEDSRSPVPQADMDRSRHLVEVAHPDFIFGIGSQVG